MDGGQGHTFAVTGGIVLNILADGRYNQNFSFYSFLVLNFVRAQLRLRTHHRIYIKSSFSSLKGRVVLKEVGLPLELNQSKINVYLVVGYECILFFEKFLSTVNSIKFDLRILLLEVLDHQTGERFRVEGEKDELKVGVQFRNRL